MKKLALAAALTMVLAGCGGSETASDVGNAALPADNALAEAPIGNETATATSAAAPLMKADGTTAGSVTATASDAGIALAISVEGLPPGEHGVHVHTVGLCEGPAFTTAGAHWNPGSRKHGLDSPEGHHAGDMPNLTVGADGRGTLDYVLDGEPFADLLDGDGSAFVVHATADDQKTDPSGNSGDRIACGVFAPS